jgi:hypothetical protein
LDSCKATNVSIKLDSKDSIYIKISLLKEDVEVVASIVVKTNSCIRSTNNVM